MSSDPHQLQIRPLHPDDIPALHAILSHPAVARWTDLLTTREYSQSEAEYRTAQTGMHRLVGILKGRVVAYGWLHQNTRPRMKHIAQPGLIVHPDHWGQGIGRRLFAALLDLADNWLNTWRVELSLSPDNAAARHMAAAAGFVVEGTMRQAIFGDGRFHDAILYTRLNPPPAAQTRLTSTPLPAAPSHPIDTSRLIIRPARPGDEADLNEIWRNPLVARTTLQLPSQEIWVARSRFGEPPPPGLHRLMAENDGRVLGMISIFQNQNPRRIHSATLGMMVAPDYWGQRIGSRLMTAILEIADNWLDLKRVELEVNADNPTAVHLYEKFGFAIEGTRRFQAFGDGRWPDSHFMARLRE